MSVLGAVTVCHLLNDVNQSVIPSIYPMLKTSFRLSFGQLGLMTLCYQLVASLLQPLVGYYTDRRPAPYLLPCGMAFTLAGLLVLAVASSYHMLLGAAAAVGIGSAVFHPESSRIARMASGGRHGFAQSLFQVGGNAGSAIGPLLAALIVLPAGLRSVDRFAVFPLTAIVLLFAVARWRRRQPELPSLAHAQSHAEPHTQHTAFASRLPRRTVVMSIAILLALIFSKYFYLASLTNYYTFYLIVTFHVSVQRSQLNLFILLGAVAAGTFIGGPVGDRIGRKYVIWGSILGVLPFTVALPHANLAMTGVLSAIIGLILASAFSAIIVYAQELVPDNVGMIAGLFFGLAFGIGGLGAAALGILADATSVTFIYRVCAWLPALGLLTAFLPDIEPPRHRG
jgi:FSR family fosmidomycin resistance protein-like MFS transporter